MVIDFSPFFNLPRNLESLLEESLSSSVRRGGRNSYPPLNISSDEENLYVRCEIPGVAIEDLEITLAESSLSIKGERKALEGKYYRQERPMGAFNRLVNINSPVDRDKVKADLKDGLLTVTLPRAAETKPRKITIG